VARVDGAVIAPGTLNGEAADRGLRASEGAVDRRLSEQGNANGSGEFRDAFPNGAESI
jgi:hypothetical protein